MHFSFLCKITILHKIETCTENGGNQGKINLFSTKANSLTEKSFKVAAAICIAQWQKMPALSFSVDWEKDRCSCAQTSFVPKLTIASIRFELEAFLLLFLISSSSPLFHSQFDHDFHLLLLPLLLPLSKYFSRWLLCWLNMKFRCLLLVRLFFFSSSPPPTSAYLHTHLLCVCALAVNWIYSDLQPMPTMLSIV